MKIARMIFAVSFILAVTVSLISTPELYAQIAKGNVATGILSSFEENTARWWGILQPIALGIFRLAVKLEIALFGIRMVLQRSNLDEILGQFVMLLFYCAFIYFVILHYEEWAKIVAISGFEELSQTLSGGAVTVNPGTPLDVVTALGIKVLDAVTEFSLPTKMFMNGIMVAVLVIIVVIFVLISALYIITVCEFHIVANVGVLLIGLGGSKTMKDYAINVMRYIFSVGIKLFVLQLIMNIGFQIITVDKINNAGFIIEMGTLIKMLAQSLLLLALAKSLPDTCAGILSGSTINSGNPLLSVARSAAGAAMGGAGLAMGAAKMGASAVGAVRGSYSMAKVGGASGVMGYAKGMGAAVLEARGAAKTAEINQNPSSIRTQLRSQGNMAREQLKLMRSGGGETAPAPMSTPAAPETGGGDIDSTSSGTGSSFPAGTSSVPPLPVQPIEATVAPASSGAAAAMPTSKTSIPASSVPQNDPATPLPPSPRDMATVKALKTKARTVDMRTPNLGD